VARSEGSRHGRSTREISGKIEQETRYYITSLVILAHLLGPVVRSHWAIENSLHWVMGMVFRDDECRVRTDHAPANFTTIKHMALNLLKRKPAKQSLRGRRKAAGWDDEFVIGAQVWARRCAYSERPRSSQWQAANTGAGVIRRGEAGL